MGTSLFYINGQFVTSDKAMISPLDLGVLRGYGIFDYLRTYRGKPFHLLDHLERLRFSAHTVGITLPKSLDEISMIIRELLLKNLFSESSIKVLITGGESSDQITPGNTPSLFIFNYPFNPYDPLHYEKGIKTITTSLSRCLPAAKTTHYIPGIIALKKAHAQHAIEALHLNEKREILEATTSNFFAFKKNTLIAPAEEIILGITREVILRLTKKDFKIEYRTIAYEEIPHLDEAFITSSNKEIMPVIAIDSIPIGDMRIGKNTHHLMQLFKNYTDQDNWSHLNIFPQFESLSEETLIFN